MTRRPGALHPAAAAAEIRKNYEANTGKGIVAQFAGADPLAVPAVLVAQHGPFVWGASAEQAVINAAVLERQACMASETLRANQLARPIPQVLLDKHFLRKHGDGAYYGQR